MYIRTLVSFLVVAALATFSLASTIDHHQLHDVSLDTAVRKGPDVGVNFEVDVVAMTELITDNIRGAQNRAAFVKTIRTAAYHGAKENYNVVVFNMAVEHRPRFRDIKYFKSYTYRGLHYGVWVFGSGSFHNKGDGGFINWAYQGCVQRDRGYLLFRSHSRRGSCTRPTVSSVTAPCHLQGGDRCSHSGDCCDNRSCKRKWGGPKRCR